MGGRKHAPGYVAGLGHSRGEQFSIGDHGIKVALITDVDDVNMKATLKIITGGGEDAVEVDLTQAQMGPRSFWGGIPENNSLVLLGYRQLKRRLWMPVILGYIPQGNRAAIRFDPFSPVDPNEVAAAEAEDVQDFFGPTYRLKRLKLRAGDVGGMSAAGAEFALTKDVLISNRAGDLIELRDNERTLVTQAIHRVEAASGLRHISGPIRRSAFFFPPDLFKTDVDGNVTEFFKDEDDGYFGIDELRSTGPDNSTKATKNWADEDGWAQPGFINNPVDFPPTTYANGKRTHYVVNLPGVSFESENGLGSEVFTESRMELSHTSDLQTNVLDEIDGFGASARNRRRYIELVYGTVVGNDPYSLMGMRQYARPLQPQVFKDFEQETPGRFMLNTVDRSPTDDSLVNQTAGAFLFRINPIVSAGDQEFAVAVSKQGKFFANIPGSRVENYATTREKNVSAEINCGGGIKVRLGATSPSNTSVHLVADGGIRAKFGHFASGESVHVSYGSSTESVWEGNPDDDGFVRRESINGNMGMVCQGNYINTVNGSESCIVSGLKTEQVDRKVVNAINGHALNCGEDNKMVSGKSQYHHAMAVLETIVTGGKSSTVLAGGLLQNIAAGAYSTTVLGGVTTFNCAGGAFNVAVGVGGIAMSAAAGAVTLNAAAGAVSVAAGAGAVSIAASLAVNLAAAVAVSAVAPQILLGGPAAVYGVSRGYPMTPGPSLDWTTGNPLQGGVIVRSI